MTYNEFIHFIPLIKSSILGGIDDQFKIAPQYRIRYDLDKIKLNNPKLASVIILLFQDENNVIRFLLTQRPDYEGFHSKQISFTGGKFNPHDENLLQTAIRETFEEVGIQISKNNIIKDLTEVYIPPSNFLVKPFLAFIDAIPLFKPNYEVDNIITPKLSQLINPNIEYKEIKGSNNKIFVTPGFIFENSFVWGATAMILSELREILIKLK